MVGTGSGEKAQLKTVTLTRKEKEKNCLPTTSPQLLNSMNTSQPDATLTRKREEISI